jgi:hypothetical protein
MSRKTVERCLNEMHYTLKQTSLIPEGRNDQATIQERADFVTEIVVHDPNMPVFVDEVGFCYTMRLSRGRSASGTRANLRVPAIRSKNNSIAAALDFSSLLMFEIQGQAYKTDSFCAYMVALCSALNLSGRTNRTTIMGNVPFHRARAVRDACVAHGHRLLHLPPYSPFLNPIENLFSKWKQLVKQSCPDSPE